MHGEKFYQLHTETTTGFKTDFNDAIIRNVHNIGAGVVQLMSHSPSTQGYRVQSEAPLVC